MIQAPLVVGLILCEEMVVGRDPPRVSLDRIFHTRRVSSFPSEPQRFTVYATLSDGAGEGVLKLTLTRLETNGIIYKYERWFAFPRGRLEPVDMEVLVKSCVFPAPGRYALTLLFDDEPVSDRTLEIQEKI